MLLCNWICAEFDEGDFDYSDDESVPESRFLKAGWEIAVSQSTGRQYYVNALTNETQYEWPLETARATALRNARMRGELTSRLPTTRSAQGGGGAAGEDHFGDEEDGEALWDDDDAGTEATAGTASVALGDVD